MEKEEKKPIKKIYDRPKLIIYGDISKITQGGATGRSSDRLGGRTG